MKFFETIQRAAIEKCHSAAIAWIFSINNTHFSQEIKNKILSNLINCNEKIHGEPINICTEHEDIDVLIEYKDVIIAMENKIKISEHGEQLKKYSQYLSSEKFKEKRLFKIFLTLINEEPSEKDWKSLNYEFLLKEIGEHPTNSEIINDYKKNLENLTSSMAIFSKDHRIFPCVFDSKIDSKEDVNENNSKEYHFLEKYIQENKIKTILQKAFFHKLSKAIDYPCFRTIISETHGSALIDFKRPAFMPAINLDGVKIGIGIQVQRSTIKIQLESAINPKEEIDKSIILDDQKHVKEALGKKSKEIEKILNSSLPGEQWRSNSSKYAYHSFSKKIQLLDDKKSLPELCFNDCVTVVKKAIKECENSLKNLESNLSNK
jgi:hypothetical protein